MSAVNSLQPPSSSGTEQRPYEPSMEEILASIRRIIADDQPLSPLREPETRGPAGVSEAAPAAHVAELAAPSAGPAPATHAGEPPRPAATVHAIAEPSAIASHPHGRIEAPQFPSMPEGTVAPPPSDESELPEVAGLGSVEDLEPDVAPISTVHDHAYDEPPGDREAYHAPEPHHGGTGAVYREPPVSEALFSEATDHSVTAAFNALAASRLADNSEELLGIARDMIRPLLKAWIDDNLPSMVERMVRAEIERVARGGR